VSGKLRPSFGDVGPGINESDSVDDEVYDTVFSRADEKVRTRRVRF